MTLLADLVDDARIAGLVPMSDQVLSFTVPPVAGGPWTSDQPQISLHSTERLTAPWPSVNVAHT